MENKNQLNKQFNCDLEQVVSFEEYKYRKQLRQELNNLTAATETRLEFRVTLIVVRYIYKYMPNKPKNELDICNLNLNIEELFKGDPELFRAAFFEIMKFWRIDKPEIGSYIYGNEFALFPTIESISTYVENIKAIHV